MLVPELINRAVAGDLRFNFIESTVSIVEPRSLASVKGRAFAEPAADYFHFHFMPRAPFSPDERERLAETPGRQFELAGTERGSAVWTATASELRIVDGMQGPAIHAHVPEWTREDARSVRASFSRIVIAGRYSYPVTVQYLSGMDARTALVSCAGIRIDFRNHGDYTEISTTSAARVPGNLADAIVTAFGELMGRAVNWVYREQHVNGRRLISVRPFAATEEPDAGEAMTRDVGPDGFWRHYAQRLGQLI